MSTTMNDSEEYYCFRVLESIDSEVGIGNENIVIIPRSYNFDLRKLRTELYKQFRVPKNRRIYYIDDDGDHVPIDSECELHEALKLAKNAFMVNTAIPLIVGPFHVPTSCSDDEQCSGKNEICDPNKESRSINDNSGSSCTEKNVGSASEPNPVELDKQKRSTQKIPSNQKKMDVKRSEESSEERTELEDAEIPKKSNETLIKCHLDTAPPPWFAEYMESMKKDMMSAITHEVVKNVTDVLNKRLDSLAYPLLKELGQSRNQLYSSLPKRHPRCSFDSNEKNQKRMRSQDEEQSSDASIERVDEPQNVNTAEDLQTKKDVISTISQEVVKEMTEMLNKIPLHKSVPSKKLGQPRTQLHSLSSKRFARLSDLYSSEKNQRKMRPQDGEQSSDDASMESTYEPYIDITKLNRQLEHDLIGATRMFGANLKEEKRKKKHQRTQITTDNLTSEIGKEQPTQSNKREDFAPRKKGPPQVDPTTYNETLGIFENEQLRMSCSVTGHQILDESRRREVRNNSVIDKTSFWSCNQGEEDDDAFEIIQMPASDSKDESLTQPEESAAEQRRHDSNRDSPSFELLSEPPSPTPISTFMHFNEEHFSANEENPEQQFFTDYNMNPSTNSIYVVDIHGKIYTEHQSADPEECISADLERRSGGAYSFVTETLPVQDTHCSKSSCPEQRSSERKNSRDDASDIRVNASNLYDDVRNSHTSYLTVRTHCDSKTQSQCSCQSQTDSNDFTQSFHSHTTSVTDTTDIYPETYGNGRYGEQVPTTAKDVREAATVTATATATATVTTTPKNDHDVRVGGYCKKETRTNEQHCHDTETYPEFFSAPPSSTPQGIPVDSSYQSGQASGSSNKSSPTGGPSKIGEQMEYFFPESLVLAAKVGAFAFDTACEVFDKIRAHARENSIKR